MAVQALRVGLQRSCCVAPRLHTPHNLLAARSPLTPAPCATIIPYREERQSKIKKPHKEVVKEGYGMLREELDKMRAEWKKIILMDHLYDMNHGDYEVVWKFDNKEVMKNWVVTTDRDNDEGKSQAEFILGPEKTAVFRGYVNTEVPKDGITKASGYCNIKSAPNMRSFKRQEPLDWTDFTHLIVKCRGDGRSYQLLLHMNRYFDVQWEDTYQFPLFTRGGPYWQIAKIPFSKFFLANQGRIQDKQDPIDLDNVLAMGITLADSNRGPFQLEIDYVGLIVDESHTQIFAYEMYEVPAHLTY